MKPRRLKPEEYQQSVDLRIAIDPGDVHVGWAWRMAGVVVSGEWAYTDAPTKVQSLIETARGDGQTVEVVIEEFVLYPGRAKEQAGSEFKTSQLIGVLKFVCERTNTPFAMQGATIKKPTHAQMRARKLALAGGNRHSMDAQLHLWYRTIRDHDSLQEEGSLMVSLEMELYQAFRDSMASEGIETDGWDDLADGEKRAWAAVAVRASTLFGEGC